MKDLLLDTDTISYFFRNEPSVLQVLKVNLEKGLGIHISAINYYEICNGLYYKDAKRQLNRFLSFVDQCTVLPLTAEIASTAAKCFANLRKRGIIIQHTDALIAGTAIVHDLRLVTNNTKHYEGIEGLLIENWLS
ncbi:MAG: type II toxin-antitoxin system VapC family toxin [Bacteroidota bacterium]